MAMGNDHEILLGEDTESAVPVEAPRRHGRSLAVALCLVAVAACAAWKSRSPTATALRVQELISAAAASPIEDPAQLTFAAPYACDAAKLETQWPHPTTRMNWLKGKCSDTSHLADDVACRNHIIEKYVGDFFDNFIKAIEATFTNAAVADKRNVPGSSIGIEAWKNRVIARVQSQEKGKTDLAQLRNTPTRWQQQGYDGPICKAIYEERPAVRTSEMTFASLYHKVNTNIPNSLTRATVNLCNRRQTVGVAVGCDSEPIVKDVTVPAEYSWDTNPVLAKCRHLFDHNSYQEDWIEAALTVLDVRRCLPKGSDRLPLLSRSWVKGCIPDEGKPSHYSPQRYGWPGWVFEFIGQYGIVGSDCVADHEGLVYFEGEKCPSQCDNGESLTSHLRRLEQNEMYRVIFQTKPLDPFHPHSSIVKYIDLSTDQHLTAMHYIYSEGPIVGLVLRSNEFVLPAAEDTVMLYVTCHKELVVDGDIFDDAPAREKIVEKQMHSVVVHGWGSEGRAESEFYRVMSSIFQKQGHEVKVSRCAVKMFVIPNPPETPSAGANQAAPFCERARDFCGDGVIGYTDTEDCDGDGILDHYCYLGGDALTPPYEAFISSKQNCKLLEDQRCSRRVLPGLKMGCQRPLGWCMNGEHYHRDKDCDGDGHPDHICEAPGHNGYISSAKDCIDTWGQGTQGMKCEPKSPILAAMEILSAQGASYKLVVDEGPCIQHEIPSCVQSHAEWPNIDYPVTSCKIRVEGSRPIDASYEVEVAGCDRVTVPNETLFLDVLHADIEKFHLTNAGEQYGDLLRIGSEIVPEELGDGRFSVKAETMIEWKPDQTVEKRGWLACLRLRSKPPKLYRASCTEIGDDIWKDLDIHENEPLAVQCDMTKCDKNGAFHLSGTQDNRFLRTSNVCAAGWQITKSSKFTISFSAPRFVDKIPDGFPTFEVDV